MSGSTATASRDHVYSQNANGARKQAGSVPVSYVPTVRLHAKNGQIFRGSAPNPATASNLRGSTPNPATASRWWDVQPETSAFPPNGNTGKSSLLCRLHDRKQTSRVYCNTGGISGIGGKADGIGGFETLPQHGYKIHSPNEISSQKLKRFK